MRSQGGDRDPRVKWERSDAPFSLSLRMGQTRARASLEEDSIWSKANEQQRCWVGMAYCSDRSSWGSELQKERRAWGLMTPTWMYGRGRENEPKGSTAVDEPSVVAAKRICNPQGRGLDTSLGWERAIFLCIPR